MEINQTLSAGALCIGLGILFWGVGSFFRGLSSFAQVDRERWGFFKKK
jgi:hypothetical protein